MRKQKWILNALILLVLLFIAACGNEQSSSENSGEKKEENTSYKGIIPVYTPPSGNTAYVLSAGLSNLFNQEKLIPDVQFSTEATSGDNGMIEQLIKRYDQGKPAFASTTNLAAARAFEGTFEQVPGEHSQIRAVANLNSNAIHLVVKANSGIDSYADLKGKKLGGFAPGIGPRFFVEDLLSEYFDIKPDEYEMIPLDNKDRVDSVSNGSVDGAFLLGTVPSPLVTELARTEDVKVISIDEEILKKISKDHPYYSYVTIEPGTYPGTEETVHVGTIGVMYITHENTPDEIVYEFLKTIIENPDDVKQMHPSFNITLENVTEGISIPFHEGAKKYLEENGVTVE